MQLHQRGRQIAARILQGPDVQLRPIDGVELLRRPREYDLFGVLHSILFQMGEKGQALHVGPVALPQRFLAGGPQGAIGADFRSVQKTLSQEGKVTSGAESFGHLPGHPLRSAFDQRFRSVILLAIGRGASAGRQIVLLFQPPGTVS